MITKEQLIKETIELIDKALQNKHRITVSFENNLFEFSDDSSGQRLHFLSDFNYQHTFITSNSEMKGFYRINRELSFTNKIDKYKDLGTLGIINIEKCSIITVKKSIPNTKIHLDYITIIINYSKTVKALNYDSVHSYLNKDNPKNLPLDERLTSIQYDILKEYIVNDEKIKAIKFIKEKLKIELIEAKEYIDVLNVTLN